MTPWFDLPKACECGWQAPGDVAVIGAGVAGLCAARALIKVGFNVTLYDAGERCAAEASGSPAAVIKPYVTKQPSDAMRLHLEAYFTFQQWLNTLPQRGGFKEIGALQLVEKSFSDSACLTSKYSAKDNAVLYSKVDQHEASKLANATVTSDALMFANAGWLSARELCDRLLNDINDSGCTLKTEHKLTSHQYDQKTGYWHLEFQDQPAQFCRQVVLAQGSALPQNAGLTECNLTPARGQITAVHRQHPVNTVITGNHYIVPDLKVSWVGATFERGESGSHTKKSDNDANLKTYQELLPDETNTPLTVCDHFASTRCTTQDRLPLVGPMPRMDDALKQYSDLHHGRQPGNYSKPSFHLGLAIVGGLGSRGVTTAPYCAELLADWAGNGNRLQQQNRLLSPLRFLIRQLKRSQTSAQSTQR